MGTPARHRLDEVFGINRDLPLNYVVRRKVDEKFVASLTRDRHVVVFGSSKQGKTSLRKHNLQPDDYELVTCSNRLTLSQLHSAILKAVGYRVEQSTTRTASGDHKVTAKFGAGITLPLVGTIGGGVESSDGEAESATVSTVSLELDPGDVNDVITALKEVGFAKYIVLEDFHYLPDEVQREFSEALKAFHESSPFCFIIVGVWLDKNRLIQFNGDLTGRVIAVNADAWSPNELRQVIASGERLLNVKFDPEFSQKLIENCFESVAIVQEVCHLACERAGMTATRPETITIGRDEDALELVAAIVDDQSARYHSFLENFADGFQDTELEMYRWLLAPVVTSEPTNLEHGLTYTAINRYLRRVHPRGDALNQGNVSQALASTVSLQVGKLRIKPIILDFNQSSRRLNVVDRGFLIWLSRQAREDLLEAAGLPDDVESFVA